MTAAGLRHDAFAPAPLPGMRSGFGLAVAAHVLLVLALAWSVNWKASEPEGVVAELWSAVPQMAAPRAAAPEPAPAPPVVEPRPAPPPVRREPAPAPAPPREDAQIAVERARQEKERQLEVERAELARQAEKKRRDDARRAQEVQREAQQKQRAAEDLAEKKAAEAEQKKKAAEQVRKDDARLAAIRESNLRRAREQAGSGNGDDASTGSAARSSGPSAGYAGRIKARIKPNIVLTGGVDGNPTAEVEVRLAPDGTIVGRKITRSSGSPVWDQTVLRAIDKTEVLPKDVDGRVPPVMVMTFRPAE